MENNKKQGVTTYLRGHLKVLLLVGGALLGIVFLLFGGLPKKAAVTAVDDLQNKAEALEAYRARTEKELEQLCEAANGVSDVRVMVTLSGGYEAHYVRDDGKKAVTVGAGSGETALFSYLSPPTVAGVGIVCRGGGDPAVQNTLTELVAAALDIPRNRVYITGR